MKAFILRLCLFLVIFYLLSKYFPGVDHYIFVSVLGVTGIKYLYEIHHGSGTSEEYTKTENTP